jgi:four helix bundle protein
MCGFLLWTLASICSFPTPKQAFPYDERYSMTSQIRRSSRSVAANLAEGYRKRRYPSMFVSKLADSDAEATETQGLLTAYC